jgi:hypothetical protein
MDAKNITVRSALKVEKENAGRQHPLKNGYRPGGIIVAFDVYRSQAGDSAKGLHD